MANMTRDHGAGLERPPFDAELIDGLERWSDIVPSTITSDNLIAVRAARVPGRSLFEGLCREQGLRVEDYTVPSFDGASIVLTVIRPTTVNEGPCAYFVHGGGMFMGDRFSGAALLVDLVARLGMVGVTVEYRLAPEFPDPVPREDCYAGLKWVLDRSEALRVDRNRIILVGRSAGGALAGGLAHRARDEGERGIFGQMLVYPMLDDRAASISCEQFSGVGMWDRTSNETGWAALLGERRGGPEVGPYTAPARSTALTGLPPTYLEVGTNDVLRDEIVDYATRLTQSGVSTELHMWPGASHGFDEVAPESRSAGLARHLRLQWAERLMAER